MVLRQSASYMAANLTVALFGFIAVIALTRLVPPGEYGLYIVAVATANVVAISSFTWLRHAILRFQSVAGADVRLAVLTGYAGTLLTYPLVFAVLVWLIRQSVAEAMVALLFAAALCFFELGQEVLRARQQVSTYVVRAMVRSSLALAGVLIVAMIEGGGLWLAVVMASGYLVGALLFANRLWAAPIAPFDRATLITLARYGLPITVSGVFVALTTTLDRFVLDALLGPDAVGRYGAAADFVRQCAIVPAVSASLAIAPLAVSALGQQGGATTARHLADGLELLLLVLLPAAVGIAIAAPQIAHVMLGPDYRATAGAVMPILAFAFLMHMLSQQYVQLSFSLANKPGLYSLHTGAILAVNAIAIVPLVLWLGLIGAAVSFLLAEIFGVAFGLLLAHRTYPLPLIPGRAARIVLATAGMGLVAFGVQRLLGRVDVIGLTAIVAAAGLTYVALLIALDIFEARRRLTDHVLPRLRREVRR